MAKSLRAPLIGDNMGTWGTALFSDDTACDVRDDYIEILGDGLTGSEATERLLAQWSDSLKDQDEAPVFWLALAATQWRYGRLESRVRQEAINVIDKGTDLARWKSSPDYRKRRAVLEKLRAKLLSPPPPEKQVRKRFRDSNEWKVGDLVAYRLLSGRRVILRVIGHHADKGGRAPICELLDWVGEEVPDRLQSLGVHQGARKMAITQFMIARTRLKERPDDRLQHLPLNLAPAQKPGRYAVTLWRLLDDMLKLEFELE
jgi:hypothetical protein